MSCCGGIRTSTSGSCTAAVRRRRPDTYRSAGGGLLALLDGLVVLVLAVVVDDPQDLDETESGSQATQGRRLVGVDLGHGPIWIAPRWLVASSPQMQVHPAALDFEFVAFGPVMAR